MFPLNKKKQIMIRIILVLSIGIFALVSCNSNHCKNDANIEVSELLYIHTSDRDIEYCKLLKGAISNNNSDLMKLLKLEILDGAAYDHGIVLYELVDYLGESKFIELTVNLTAKDRKAVLSYLRAGVEYDSKNETPFNEKFPMILENWNK